MKNTTRFTLLAMSILLSTGIDASQTIADLQAENQRLQAQIQTNLQKIAQLQQQTSQVQPAPISTVTTEVKTVEVTELPEMSPEQAQERLRTIERQVQVMREGIAKDQKRIQNYDKLLRRYQGLVGRTRSRRSRGIYQKKIRELIDKIGFLNNKIAKDTNTIQTLEEEAERIG